MSDTQQALQEWLSHIPDSLHNDIRNALKQMGDKRGS